MTDQRRGSLEALRDRIDRLNRRILDLLNERSEVAREIGEAKQAAGLPMFDPSREKQQIQRLSEWNRGPMPQAMVEHIFREIFRTTLTHMESHSTSELGVSRQRDTGGTVVRVGNVQVGDGEAPVLVAGPCAIENKAYLDEVARHLSARGVGLFRGGAFKPRTSPYDFQGLGMEAVEWLSEAGRACSMATVTEVTDPRLVEAIAERVDMLQVGARNMFNFELLKEVGKANKPVLLKRSFAAKIDELLYAAEYIWRGGNTKIVLCERGIRTFETATRSTLDISAVCLLKQQTHLPVLVDVSHAAGRKDILVPLSRAALAAGANGLMVEVHACPSAALSDGTQQMDLSEFDDYVAQLGQLLRLS